MAMFGRLSNAVSDFTETLRQVFQNPTTHYFDPALAPARSRGMVPLTAVTTTPDFSLCPVTQTLALALPAQSMHLPTAFEGRLQAEDGWNHWATGAVVCQMPVFGAQITKQLGIPALPRRAACFRQEPATFRTATRNLSAEFQPPAVRGGSPDLGTAVTHRALEMALGLPIAFAGQDVQSLPKPLWMRYSLQLVKSTGDNIRNLEVLGLYRIPAKGVAGMRHDAKSGNLMLELTPEAGQAARLPFLLARRKDDRSLVSCFLEEG